MMMTVTIDACHVHPRCPPPAPSLPQTPFRACGCAPPRWPPSARGAPRPGGPCSWRKRCAGRGLSSLMTSTLSLSPVLQRTGEWKACIAMHNAHTPCLPARAGIEAALGPLLLLTVPLPASALHCPACTAPLPPARLYCRRYKLWDMAAPVHPRFFIDSQGIASVKIASDAVLLSMVPEQPGELELRLLDLVDGSCVKVRAASAGAVGARGEGGRSERCSVQHLRTERQLNSLSSTAAGAAPATRQPRRCPRWGHRGQHGARGVVWPALADKGGGVPAAHD